MDARESGSPPSRSKTARLSGSESTWKAFDTTVTQKERSEVSLRRQGRTGHEEDERLKASSAPGAPLLRNDKCCDQHQASYSS